MPILGTRAPKLLEATAGLDTPFALIDESALWHNAHDLVARAGGTPIRLSTKSVRVRALIRAVLTVEGFEGVMTYSLPESNWLADHGVDDILLAYPTTHRQSLLDLVEQEHRRTAITVMVDSLDQLDFIDDVLGREHPTLRVCLDVDASYRRAGLYAGVRRSPVHTSKEARHLAAKIVERPNFDLVGLMFYDAQIAGIPDDKAAVRHMKSRSIRELRNRRRRITKTVGEMTNLRIVNSGGTGSLHIHARDPALTELTAGSGLFLPTSFDNFRGFQARPAAYFVTSVVRKPADDIVTCFSGGYAASGPGGDSRTPTPVSPAGLSLLDTEGAGEVQTPLRGEAAKTMKIGDRVLFRHTKAGEMCERFNEIALVSSEGTVVRSPTYRGEGRNFG